MRARVGRRPWNTLKRRPSDTLKRRCLDTLKGRPDGRPFFGAACFGAARGGTGEPVLQRAAVRLKLRFLGENGFPLVQLDQTLLRYQGGESLVRRAWLEVYGRPATSDELTASRQFLAAQAEQNYSTETDIPTTSQPHPGPPCLEPHKAAAYVDFCHALLNSTEFLFVD